MDHALSLSISFTEPGLFYILLSVLDWFGSNPTIGGEGGRRKISPIAWGMWPKRHLQGVG